MTENNGRLCFSEKERCNVWKGYVDRIMNEENDWDHDVEDATEGPVVCESREEMLQALNEMKIRMTPGPSEVSLVLITVSWVVGIQVMAEAYQ